MTPTSTPTSTLVGHDAMIGYERKLLAGLLFLVLASLPVLVFAILSLSSVSTSQDRLNRVFTGKLLLIQDLRMQKAQQNALMPIFVITGDRSILAQINRVDHDFDATLRQLETLASTSGAGQPVARIRTLQQSLRGLARSGIEMKLRGASITDVNSYFRRMAGPDTGRIDEALDRFDRDISAAYETAQRRNAGIFRAALRILVFASIVSIVLCLVVGALLVRLVNKKRQNDQILHRLARQEKQLSNARKEAVETVAHDLKNPLTAIMLQTDYLSTRLQRFSHDEITALVGRIGCSAGSMQALIANLLDHTNIEADSMSLSRTTENIRHLLDRLVSRLGIIADGKNIRFDNDVASDLPLLSIDTARIEQVFSNLLGNAIKFTAPGGRIELRSRVEEAHVVISVVDNGSGMTASQLRHVFTRYWQARETASEGSGLGLAIARSIVVAHGGSIEASSRAGLGSRFDVALPVTMIPAVPTPA